jgi:hypothetical protein
MGHERGIGCGETRASWVLAEIAVGEYVRGESDERAPIERKHGVAYTISKQ